MAAYKNRLDYLCRENFQKMLKRLLSYLEKQLSAFDNNFVKVCDSFDFDAIHDMRVAVKRLRALMILAEKLEPSFNIAETEGELRQLFKLSGKMRDAQVQQSLLADYAQNLNISFGEYDLWLRNFEKKSIKKFTSYLKVNTSTDFTRNLSQTLSELFNKSENAQIVNAINNLVEDLLAKVREMNEDQQHDEQLHEIRRKLKQCNYLLSVFDKDDPDLPGLNKTLQLLEKANNLLGEWHDHDVAREFLFNFLNNKSTVDYPGYSRYKLLLEKTGERKHFLHMEIIRMMESELGNGDLI